MTKARLLRLLLLPFAFVYGLVMQLRNWAYDKGIFKSYAISGVRVISVGNLSVGGTGKTPMAEYLLRTFADKGKKVAYLSRGYGRSTKGYQDVKPGEVTADDVGDEALQVALRFPGVHVAVCENRVVGVETLKQKFGVNLVVLDDAFQHRRIARDLDIVMIDANRPPWEDYLLPAGRLREPARNLKRADVVVVNKLSDKSKIQRFAGHLLHKSAYSRLTATGLVSCSTGEIIPVAQLAQRNCVAFSALGNNEAFYSQLKSIGITVLKPYPFRDHHRILPNEFQRIRNSFRGLLKQDIYRDPLVLITTEKDYVRLKDEDWFKLQAADLPIYYLQVKLEFLQGEDHLARCFSQLLENHGSYHSAAV